MQTETNRCPKCQAPLPADAPQGLCPKCLLAAVATPTETGQLPRGGSPAPSLEAIADAFPQLEILELFGQGGMGFIFKARQPKLDRFVALKILPQALAADPTFAERFNREARVLARLNHPNIVTVHDFGQAGGFFYLLMEFVDGVNLRQAMQAGRFTPAQALAIVPKICEALQFAHNEGILHRDIKPENILLDAKGRVKIADFGIAKLIGDAGPESSATTQAGSPLLGDDSLTESGKALGTPNYMAPEQRDNPQNVDNRADIYSLGVVFYEMLTGELPTGRFAPPSQKSAADPRVDAVVARALEKEKEKRFASAEEVKTRVETISASAGIPPIGRTGEAKSDAPPVVYATKKKKGEFLGVGCAVQAIGLGCLFVPFIGIPLGLVLLMIGGRMALKLICSNCGNYTTGNIKICASCGAHFEKPIPTATKPANEPSEPPQHQNWLTWSPLNSPQVNEICSHLTKSELMAAQMLGLLFGVWVVGAAFGIPFIVRSSPGPGSWVVACVLILIFLVSLPVLYRIQRQFLCSTAWARKQGFTPESLPLFAFKTANIQTAIVWLAGLLLLLFIFEILVPYRVGPPAMARLAQQDSSTKSSKSAPVYLPLLRVTLRIIDAPAAFDTRQIIRPAALFDHGDVRVLTAPYVVVTNGFEGEIQIPDFADPLPVGAAPMAITGGRVKTLFVKPTLKMGSSFVQITLSAMVPSSGTNNTSASKQMLRSNSIRLGEFDLMEDNAMGNGRKHLAVLSVELEPQFAEDALASADGNSTKASAETWSPTLSPDTKPDFEKMRQEATDAMNQGRFEESLQRHLWYHIHALEYDPAQSGVRLSFWLADWMELGRRYPKAKQALLDIRDENTRKLAEGRGHSQLFSDVASINGYLQDEEASYALFKTIQQKDPALATQCYFYVESLLVKKGEYELCMQYMGDPQRRFESNRSAWEIEKRMHQRQANLPVPTNMPSGIFRRPDMMREADKRFVRNMNQLIEILVGAGHKDEAEKIRDQALALVDDPALKSSVEDAAKKIRKY